MDLFFDQPSATRMVAMLKLPDYMDILALKKEGHSIRAIAQMCGHSRNTVRRVLRGGHTLKCYRFNWRHISCRTGVIGILGSLPNWHPHLR
ncbi:MAG: helix-turn-helix domain-containing protein, partial [Limisphaerales bacterium]